MSHFLVISEQFLYGHAQVTAQGSGLFDSGEVMLLDELDLGPKLVL